MTVTSINPPRRPPRAEVQALQQLPSLAAQIRHACDQMPAPVTVAAVRVWLADRGVETTRRETVSRVVNQWRESQGLTATPPNGITIPTTEVAAPEHAPVTPPPAPPEPIIVTTIDLTEGVAPTDADPITDPVTPLVAAPVTAPVTVPVTPPAPAPVTLEPAPTVTVTASEVTPDRAPVTLPTVTDPVLVTRSRRLRWASYVVLAVVAAAGAVLSYQSLYEAAAVIFPQRLAIGFPLLVDALIVGASLAYLAGATVGRGRAGWRVTAHAGVIGTVTLNALAADHLRDVPWHIAAPIVWSALVELTARDLLGDYRSTHARPDSIPLALWLTAPGESASTWLRVRRQAAHATARLDVGTTAAAREALRMALPGWRARRTRRIIARQLRAGSVTPQAVLDQAVAIMGELPPYHPHAVLRDVLAGSSATRQEVPPITR